MHNLQEKPGDNSTIEPRVVGRIQVTVGEVIADNKGDIRLRLAAEVAVNTSGWIEEIRETFEQINKDIEAGFDLVGPGGTGRWVMMPLGDKDFEAIRKTIRFLMPIEVRVEKISQIDTQ